MRPVLPVRTFWAEQTHVHFVDQARRPQGVIGSFLAQIAASDATQLRVHQRHQLVSRLFVSAAQLSEQRRDLARERAWTCQLSAINRGASPPVYGTAAEVDRGVRAAPRSAPMDETTARYQRLRALFDEALRKDPSARHGYLDQACADDPTLRPELQRLLDAHQKASSFLERPVEFMPPSCDARRR